ncbi:MAG TPA: TraM recognition domain-containing protein, partial [Phycisphaerales bacterium]|nr:TraM recognition domain-containing protein [Phycisphaerales bacterium]
MIARGAGGFIACTKPDEAESVLATCRKLGREGDVIHVTPGGRHFFNWLEYDLRRGGKGAGIPANMAETLSTFTSFVRPEQTLHEGENTHFFKENANRLFIQSLKLIQLAGVTATLDLIADIVTSAPKCQDDAEGPRFKQTAIAVLLQMARESGGDKEEIKGADRFWTKEVYQGSDRALGDIALTLATSLFRLRENPVRDLIACKDGCSFVPEMAEAGAIILLEAPAMEYQSTGRLITRMHKFLFQEAMKRRRVRPDLRPVFIYCDEAQSYLVPTDSDFQQVCRESKVATIYLSQSISNYEAVLGNRERAEQLLSSLTLKIYHANSGPTNEWASRQIADAWQQMTSHTYGERGSRESNSISINKQRNAQVLPGDFTRLRTGG